MWLKWERRLVRECAQRVFLSLKNEPHTLFEVLCDAIKIGDCIRGESWSVREHGKLGATGDSDSTVKRLPSPLQTQLSSYCFCVQTILTK